MSARLVAAMTCLMFGCQATSSGDSSDTSTGGVSFVPDTQPGPKDTAGDTGSSEVPLDTGSLDSGSLDTVGIDGDAGNTDVGDAETPDIPTGPCPVNGASCSDGDPCTAGDQCQNGACTGSPVVCDDKLACTVDVCTDGDCKSSLTDGFCLIAGSCWPANSGNPASVCQRCDPLVSSGAWTNLDGPCSVSSACGSAGVCVGGQCSVSGSTCPDDGNPCTTAQCEASGCVQIKLTGSACDDGSSCTTGDTCSNGACIGSSGCPDDGNPCTDPGCSAGGCTTVIKAGPCDDGKACTLGDTCLSGTCAGTPGAENCTNGADDDCDGKTDALDADDCGSKLGKACADHASCHPEGVCAIWLTGGARCGARCGKQSDCPAGQMCSRMPGSSHVSFCETAPPAGLPAGSPCAAHTDCAAGLCLDSSCRTPCTDAAGCSAGQTCAFYATSANTVVSLCISGGGIANGSPCTQDFNSYGGELCASGLCDLAPSNPAKWNCTPVCNSESDCTKGQECGLMAYISSPNVDAVPYKVPEFTDDTYDGVTGCYTNQQPGGTLTDGLPCTADNYSFCAGYKCMAVGNGTFPDYRCTSVCAKDSDCVPGMKCKLAPLTLLSEYLLTLEDPGQPAVLTAYSYSQICYVPSP